MAEARTAAENGGMSYSKAGDCTHHSITQSALFSTLDRLPPTPSGWRVAIKPKQELEPPPGPTFDPASRGR